MLKYYLKDHDEVLQSVKDPKHAAFKSITAEMCQRWIHHSGINYYCIQLTVTQCHLQ